MRNENLVEGIFSYDVLRNVLLWAITLHYSDEIDAPNRSVVHYCDFRKLGKKVSGFWESSSLTRHQHELSRARQVI